MLQEGARVSLLPLSSRAKIESTFWALHAWGIESSDERHSPSLPPLRAALRYRTPPHVLHSFLSRYIFFILLHIHNIHIKFLAIIPKAPSASQLLLRNKRLSKKFNFLPGCVIACHDEGYSECLRQSTPCNAFKGNSCKDANPSMASTHFRIPWYPGWRIACGSRNAVVIDISRSASVGCSVSAIPILARTPRSCSSTSAPALVSST